MGAQQKLNPLWLSRCQGEADPEEQGLVNYRSVLAVLLSLGLVLLLTGCQAESSPPPRKIVLEQTWELQPGDEIGGYLVAASLGDISIYLRGKALKAPYAGEVEPAAAGVHCVYFSTSEIPAYLFRFCGLRRPRLGPVNSGEVIGTADYVHFATLRRQPDGAWAIIEPSSTVLERALQYHE